MGSVLIRPALRRHVHAFYAFARNADDIADNAELAVEEKLERLDAMEAVLLGARSSGSPSAAALRASLGETGVASTHACELLIAFRQDAVKSRYASWAELMAYCRHSAMPVGRYVLDLHGEDRGTWPASDALCAWLQILNHLQDASRDLRRLDRCYLPSDWLAAERAAPGDLLGSAETPGLRRVFGFLLNRCDGLDEQARELPGQVRDRRLRVEVAVIGGLARRLARLLRARDPVARRVRLRAADVMLAIAGAVRHLP